MNDKTGGCGRRRAGPARAGVLAAAMAGIALLAACGGGGGGSSTGSPAAAGSTAYQQALAFARCMRSHGEPSWPDPDSGGNFSTGQIDLNSPLVSSALNACGQPPHGVHFQLSAAQQQALIKQALKFAACVRAHGMPNWPDPDVQGAKYGGIGFSTNGLVAPGQTLNSLPRFPAAQKACEPLMGGGS